MLVDYAHTPHALEQVLLAGRELARGETFGGTGRLVVVFGCGGDRDRGKRPQMGRIAAAHADRVVVTSDNPRSEDAASIAAAVAEGVVANDTRHCRTAPPMTVELDRRAAIRLAISEADAGDVIVIAGKGHEVGQTTGTTTVAFDDRVVAREELEAFAWT